MATDPTCKKCKWYGAKEQIETGVCLNCDSRDKYGNFEEIKMTKQNDEALQKVLKKIWEAGAYAVNGLVCGKEYADYQKITLDHTIQQINGLHKSEVVLDEGKIKDLIIPILKKWLPETLMGVSNDNKISSWTTHEQLNILIAHAIAQAGINKLGKEAK